MEEVVEDTVALADGLGVDQSSVLGHSMGVRQQVLHRPDASHDTRPRTIWATT